MARPIHALIACLAIVLCFGTLAGCGKKSALTPPEQSEYPKQYPRR